MSVCMYVCVCVIATEIEVENIWNYDDLGMEAVHVCVCVCVCVYAPSGHMRGGAYIHTYIHTYTHT